MTVNILIGDVRARLADLADDSVDCVCTSPPYWGLRDYDVVGQIGLEPTLGEHLEVMLEVFRAVRRVLKPSGTLWLNYGDCYATSPNGRSAADTKAAGGDDRTFRDKPFSTIGGVLKPKDLCMVPNRLAIALQEDGWWVRSEIIWAKPNPMPESVTDRPATSHEKIFLLTKSARYYYNAIAVRQAAADDTIDRYHRGRSDTHKYADGGPGNQTIAHSFEAMADRNPKPVRGRSNRGRHTLGEALPLAERREPARASETGPRHAGHINHTGIEDTPRGEGLHLRNYEPEPPLNKNANGFRGGSYVNGQPGARTETGNQPGTGDRNLRNYEPAPMQVWVIATRAFSEAHFATFPPELAKRCLTAGCPPGGMVLDPFGGAGTVGMVADQMGMDCTLIELNPKYVGIAQRRVEKDAGFFASVTVSEAS